jgi:hypothetical protein
VTDPVVYLYTKSLLKLSAYDHEKKLSSVVLLFQIPVNPADNVPSHLKTTRYSVPSAGVLIDTIPVPYLFVVIFGFAGTVAEL